MIPQNGHTEFRFFDNRQKYLLFVNTCSKKWVIGKRISKELEYIRPTPPSIRIFDAGIGDGTVLSRIWRAMHHRFPTMPFTIQGKEIRVVIPATDQIENKLKKTDARLPEHGDWKSDKYLQSDAMCWQRLLKTWRRILTWG